MGPTNIELYEALKKDVSEDSARMIAEGLSQASDVVTRAEFRGEVTAIVRAEVSAAESRLKAYIDSRLLRYTAVILVPVSLTMLGAVGALIVLVVKL